MYTEDDSTIMKSYKNCCFPTAVPLGNTSSPQITEVTVYLDGWPCALCTDHSSVEVMLYIVTDTVNLRSGETDFVAFIDP